MQVLCVMRRTVCHDMSSGPLQTVDAPAENSVTDTIYRTQLCCCSAVHNADCKG